MRSILLSCTMFVNQNEAAVIKLPLLPTGTSNWHDITLFFFVEVSSND